MEYQPDDIRRYVRLTESSPVSEVDAETLFEGIEVPNLDPLDTLLEDAGDLIFKLQSYSENDGSTEYKQGIEEGLSLAADMLKGLLERYSGQSRK